MAYQIWGVCICLNTVLQYIALFPSVKETINYGAVMPDVAIAFGTITSLSFISSQFNWLRGDSHLAFLYSNYFYLAVTLGAMLADVILFLFAKDKFFCDAHA